MTAEIVIVGGGISGMSLAYFCAAAGKRVLVLESEPQLGGCLASDRGPADFWFELGAHTCYNSYGSLLEIIGATIGVEQLLSRERAPFKLLTSAGLSSILKRVKLFELARSLRHLLGNDKAGKTVREYYGKIVGKGNYQTVFRHVFAGVVSQIADDFPADMLFKKRPRRKDVKRSFTLIGGLRGIVESVAEHALIDTRCGVSVASIAQTNDGYRLELAQGGFEVARAVGIATPANVAEQLTAALEPGLSGDLGLIGVRRLVSTGVVVREADVKLQKVGAIIAADDSFFSAVSRDVVSDDNYRGFTFHFRPGFAEADRLQRICDVLGITERDVVRHVTRESSLPALRVGHQGIIARLDRALEGQPLSLVGNYFAGMSIEDCVQRSKLEAQRLLSHLA